MRLQVYIEPCVHTCIYLFTDSFMVNCDYCYNCRKMVVKPGSAKVVPVKKGATGKDGADVSKKSLRDTLPKPE